MMNIFELQNNIKTLDDKVENGELEIEQVQDTLDSLHLALNEKVDSVTAWIQKNQATLDFLDKQLATAQKEKKRLSNLNERLNDYLRLAMTSQGLKEFKTDKHYLKIRNSRASVAVDNPERLPVDYVVSKTTYSANKKKLYEDLKAGKVINGAYLKENKKVNIVM